MVKYLGLEGIEMMYPNPPQIAPHLTLLDLSCLLPNKTRILHYNDLYHGAKVYYLYHGAKVY